VGQGLAATTCWACCCCCCLWCQCCWHCSHMAAGSILQARECLAGACIVARKGCVEELTRYNRLQQLRHCSRTMSTQVTEPTQQRPTPAWPALHPTCEQQGITYASSSRHNVVKGTCLMYKNKHTGRGGPAVGADAPWGSMKREAGLLALISTATDSIITHGLVPYSGQAPAEAPKSQSQRCSDQLQHGVPCIQHASNNASPMPQAGDTMG